MEVLFSIIISTVPTCQPNSGSVLTPDNILASLAIIISVVSILISVWTQRRFTQDRTLKDLIIDDVKTIRTEYKTFLNKLENNQCNPQFVTTWFKIMQNKITATSDFIRNEYPNRQNKFVRVLSNHVDIKRFVTGTEEFNQSFKGRKVVLSPISLEHLNELHNKLYRNILVSISDINKK